MRTPTLLTLLLCAALAGCNESPAPAPAPAPEAAPAPAPAREPAPAAPTPRPEAAPAPSAAPAPTELTPALREEARATYTSRCATCHGPEGKGDGPVSAGLVPRPRNLQDPAWQKAVTDAHLQRIITGGGLAVGKSALMPPSPDLRSKPALLDALVAHLRSFGSGAAKP